MTIFWFRRDLRLDDNTAFFHALQSNDTVLPIFIFDETILQHLEKNDARVTFIHNQLEKINVELGKINKSLAVFYGKPIDVFEKLIKEVKFISLNIFNLSKSATTFSLSLLAVYPAWSTLLSSVLTFYFFCFVIIWLS